MPVAQEEWRKAAEQLGQHVRPILDFLRAQEERPPTDARDAAAFNLEVSREQANREGEGGGESLRPLAGEGGRR